MASRLQTVQTVSTLRQRVAGWRRRGFVTALVPTMGALHEGHLELVRQALRQADRVVVTIFVNPRQFAPGEDFDSYPRDARGDTAKLKAVGAHLIYLPDGKEMYPDGFATEVVMSGPARVGLEDAFRPHFFDGVATVVAKLFIQAGCDYAVFGEKDYQQLKVVARMAEDLNIATTVIGVATVREEDGLAMSSRNVYLSPQGRAKAPLIHALLVRCGERIAAGEAPAAVCAEARAELEKAGFRVDYFEARHGDTLAPASGDEAHIRLLAAAWIDDTRLIDNIEVSRA